MANMTTGGGEWTALRERLIEFQLEHETKYGHRSDTDWQWSCHCRAEAKVGSWDACHRKTREHWADVILEALAAAAPAPAADSWYTREQLLELVKDFLNNYACSCMAIASPCPRCKVTIDEGRAVVTGVSFDPEVAAPPPQDGQGAELLGPPREPASRSVQRRIALQKGEPVPQFSGPPRGGSSSDLAEQATELRKLPEMWLEVRRKIMDGKGAAKPDAEDLSYADAMKHCAIELNRELRKYDF